MRKPKPSPPSEGIFNLARKHHLAGRLDEAVEQYRKVLERDGRNSDALYAVALIQLQKGDGEEADELLRRALSITLKGEYCLGLGRASLTLGRFGQALAALRAAAAFLPAEADVWLIMGAVLMQTGDVGQAILRLRRSVGLSPNRAMPAFVLGKALDMAGAWTDAADAYRSAVRAQPDHAEALTGLSAALNRIGRFRDAEEAGRQAVRWRPDLAEAHAALGAACFSQSRPEEGWQGLQAALRRNSGNPTFPVDLGKALDLLNRREEAFTLWHGIADLFLRLPPADLCDYARWLRGVCQWDGLDAIEARLLDIVRQGLPGVTPLALCRIPAATAADQLAAARMFAQPYRQGVTPLPPRPAAHAQGHGRERIRLGYISSDFREHAVSFLMAGVFEQHDRTRFEVTAYALGPDEPSDMRQRLKKGFDRFVDVEGLSSRQIAETIRRDGIDILIDLNGYTSGARPEVFAFRPAPVQVNFLGFPSTTGSEDFDYIIADGYCVPPGTESGFTEKIAFLPSYQPNDSARRSAVVPSGRAEQGLPEQGVVFASFNNPYKITSAFFGVWMRLLGAVPGSVLWLRAASDKAMANLRREAGVHGIDPGRLVFARAVAGHENHLARLACADLFLDTLPYNAHTTASEALFAGVPLLTCVGDTFAGRVAGSVLTAFGVPELIATSLPEYEALATGLARDPQKLAALRVRIAEARTASPLFDTRRYVATLEDAYRRMWDLKRQGRAPTHVVADDAMAAGEARGAPAESEPTVEALESALVARPDDIDVMRALAAARARRGDVSGAINELENAVAIAPETVAARADLAMLLRRKHLFTRAIGHLRLALRQAPHDIELRAMLADTLLLAGRHDEACAVGGSVDWARIAPDPKAEAALPARAKGARVAGRPLRIGYVLPDLSLRSDIAFPPSLLAAHDRARFRIHCYADGESADERVRDCADAWQLTADLSHGALAARIAADGIDVLVDLAGPLACNRPPVFARRPAPIQVSGSAAGGGLPFFDYRFTDALADPPGQGAQDLRGARPVRIESGYAGFTPPDAPPPVRPLPMAERGFVTFGSLNGLETLSPAVIALWGRILAAIPGARLVLMAEGLADAPSRRRIAAALRAAGAPVGAVELSNAPSDRGARLAAYDGIDIGLDPFPDSGIQASLEALYMGVPVVTLAAGDRVAGGVGASLLPRVGLDHLVARDEDSYAVVARWLASNVQRLSALRGELRTRLLRSTLGDGRRLVREIEAAYRAMVEESER